MTDDVQLFDPETLYEDPQIAERVRRTTRTVRQWRATGMLPEPDFVIGGQRPAYLGKTLNGARAFARPRAIPGDGHTA